jgi:hypothetical protein
MHSGKCSDRFDDRPYAHTTSVYRGLNPIRITVAFSSHTHEAQCEHITVFPTQCTVPLNARSIFAGASPKILL